MSVSETVDAAINDGPSRERIRSDLRGTFLVEAAAGTGKTTELIRRLVAVVGDGADLSRVVAVTFTDKAAGELKLRLRHELDEARRTSDPNGYYAAALAALEVAPIGTIHSFCGDLLREMPVEAEVDPGFVVCDQAQADALVSRAFEEWFQTTLNAPPDGVRRVLRLRSWSWDEGPKALLRRAASTLIEHRDFDAAWVRPDFDRKQRMSEIIEPLRELGTLAARHPDGEDYLRKGLMPLHRFVNRYDAQMAGKPGAEVVDRMEAELRSLRRTTVDGVKPWSWTGYRNRDFGGLPRAEVLTLRTEVKTKLDTFCRQAEADIAAALQSELAPIVERYVELLRLSGQLDFLDLLHRVHTMVVDDVEVRSALQRRYTHVFVDEFQDVDPLQAQLLLLLCADDPAESEWQNVTLAAGKFFAVGDPKQSVYRFRRADLSVYARVRERVLSAGGEVLELSTSFRARPALQRFINEAMAPAMGMGEAAIQAKHVPLRPFRADLKTQPAVIALPVARPYSDYRPTYNNWQIESELPAAIASFVSWLLKESGWQVGDVARPIEPRDVCLLFSRMLVWGRDATEPFLEALRTRAIPHAIQAGRGFHQREEIVALHQAMRAVEWPDDALAVHAVLRGPLLAIADHELLAFRQDVGPLHPLASTPAQPSPIADALTMLRELHIHRNRRPIAETLNEILSRTRAHAGFAFWRSPRQTLASVARLIDQARRFDARGASSFRAFVRWLDEQSGDQYRVSTAGLADDGVDGVRVMTVHRAKGLEFPVVILCDPTAAAAPSNPSRYVDPVRRVWASPLAGAAPWELEHHREEVLRADAAERVRLMYVAATRACDVLVIPAAGDGPIDGWLQKLSTPLYMDELSPSPDDASVEIDEISFDLDVSVNSAQHERISPIPGATIPVGLDTVLARHEKASSAHAMRSGFHETRAGVRVAWWDPAALEAQPPSRAGLKRMALLGDGAGQVVGQAKYDAWQQSRSHLKRVAAVPSIETRTMTEIAAERSPSGMAINIIRTGAWSADRPTGARFGTLVHALLAEVPWGADEVAIEQIARLHARLLGAPDDEREAAKNAVHEALSHPLLQRAAEAEQRGQPQQYQCFREYPVVGPDEHGEMREGVIDLLIAEADGAHRRWLVVDYKTDLGDGVPEEYLTQIELYAQAVEDATGEDADGLLFGV